jgi:hypothetical protein
MFSRRRREGSPPQNLDLDQEAKPGPATFGWIVAIAPLLYLLSLGPVVALTKNKPPSTQNIVRAVYFPLIWLHNHTPLKKPIEAYARLWGVR